MKGNHRRLRTVTGSGAAMPSELRRPWPVKPEQPRVQGLTRSFPGHLSGAADGARSFPDVSWRRRNAGAAAEGVADEKITRPNQDGAVRIRLPPRPRR